MEVDEERYARGIAVRTEQDNKLRQWPMDVCARTLVRWSRRAGIVRADGKAPVSRGGGGGIATDHALNTRLDARLSPNLRHASPRAFQHGSRLVVFQRLQAGGRLLLLLLLLLLLGAGRAVVRVTLVVRRR